MSRDVQPQRNSLYTALLPTALILGALIVVALFVLWLTDSSTAQVSSADTGELNAEVMQQFKTDYDQLGVAVGNADAPITIREFGDYQCPACGAFEPTAARIRKNLVASGKARFVFFDFPLTMHQHAQEAAIAARCADRQGKFWPYHEALYAKQNKWASLDDASSMFLDIAVESGINTKKLKQCIAHDATLNSIKQNRALGEKIGIRATPTIMVGATVFSGGVSYDRIKNLVDAQAGSSE